MFGQETLTLELKREIDLGTFNRFHIFSAPLGYGKQTLCRELAEYLGIPCVLVENKMESIQALMVDSHACNQPTLYVIKDADSFHHLTKSSILKLCEEPPMGAFIVLLCADYMNLDETILSRGALHIFPEYHKHDLRLYINKKYATLLSETVEHLIGACSCVGEVDNYYKNIDDIIQFCDKVIDNLQRITVSNALKIPKSLDIDSSGNGYGFNAFLNCLYYVIRRRMADADPRTLSKLVEMSQVVSKNRRALANKSVNKKMLADTLIIDFWKIWN